jgi:hypothetical protein
MPRDTDVDSLAKTPAITSAPERLSDILSRVVDRIVERRVTASFRFVGSASAIQPRRRATDGKLATCGYSGRDCSK